MKKQILIFTLFALLFSIPAVAQNLQVHYDLGHLGKTFSDREKITTTLEMFRPDHLGNTFFFVDMNYQNNNVTLAYWEIAREFKLGKLPINFHIEYNGGVGKGFSIPNSYLMGITYAWNASDFSKGFTFTPMYKHLSQAEKKASWQLTATWYYNFYDNLFTFSGFADCWNDRVAGVTKNVLLTEPQVWLNLKHLSGVDNKLNISLGGEIEISRNFYKNDNKLYVIPTLGAKWTF